MTLVAVECASPKYLFVLKSHLIFFFRTVWKENNWVAFTKTFYPVSENAVSQQSPTQLAEGPWLAWSLFTPKH